MKAFSQKKNIVHLYNDFTIKKKIKIILDAKIYIIFNNVSKTLNPKPLGKP